MSWDSYIPWLMRDGYGVLGAAIIGNVGAAVWANSPNMQPTNAEAQVLVDIFMDPLDPQPPEELFIGGNRYVHLRTLPTVARFNRKVSDDEHHTLVVLPTRTAVVCAFWKRGNEFTGMGDYITKLVADYLASLEI